MKKHYLVTGGAGFIGSQLIRSLISDENIKVTCIDSFDPFYPRQLKLMNIDGFEKHHNFNLFDLDIDITTPKILHDTLTQPVDVIIHLAAKTGIRPSISNSIAYQKTNILGTQTLLDFAQQTGVKQFIYASSGSVYGINKNMPWKEDEHPLPISPYAMSKLAGEMAGHVYSHLYDIRFIALRIFNTYGPGQRPDLAIHSFTKAILNNEPVSMFGNGNTSRDYTYVDDIVQGIISAINYEKSKFEIFNLGNNYTISLKDLITYIEEVVGKKAIIDQQPEQLSDVPQISAAIAKAQQLLNYNPGIPFKQGLQNFYQWFTNNKEVLLK